MWHEPGSNVIKWHADAGLGVHIFNKFTIDEWTQVSEASTLEAAHADLIAAPSLAGVRRDPTHMDPGPVPPHQTRHCDRKGGALILSQEHGSHVGQTRLIIH